AAVRLKMNDFPVGTSDRRAKRHRQSAADRPAVDGVEIIMGTSALGRCENWRTIGGRFVDEDGSLRHEHAERLPDGDRGQFSGGRLSLRAGLAGRDRAAGPYRLRKRLQRRVEIFIDRGQCEEIATRRAFYCRLVLVGEGCDRKRRADKYQLREGFK